MWCIWIGFFFKKRHFAITYILLWFLQCISIDCYIYFLKLVRKGMHLWKQLKGRAGASQIGKQIQIESLKCSQGKARARATCSQNIAGWTYNQRNKRNSWEVKTVNNGSVGSILCTDCVQKEFLNTVGWLYWIWGAGAEVIRILEREGKIELGSCSPWRPCLAAAMNSSRSHCVWQQWAIYMYKAHFPKAL